MLGGKNAGRLGGWKAGKLKKRIGIRQKDKGNKVKGITRQGIEEQGIDAGKLEVPS